MAKNYEIVSQQPRSRSAGGGIFQSVIQVRFKTKPSEQYGEVDVPAQVFTPEEVDRLITEKAAIIEAVQAL